MAPPADVATSYSAAPHQIAPHKDFAHEYEYKLQAYLKHVEDYKPSDQLPHKADVPHSGPQGKVTPLTIIDDPSDWTAESLKGKEAEYTYKLSESDIREIIASTDKIKARISPTEEAVKKLTREDYELPTFGPKLIEAVKNVSLGRGFHILSGFPVAHYKGDRFGLIVAYWGLALTLGEPQVSQTDYNNKRETFGSILNHISVGRHTGVKRDVIYPQTQAYGGAKQGRPFDLKRLVFHSDQGATDLIALLSISTAKEGGVSKWVSAVAIHNELLRRGRKDLVEVLSRRGIWKVPKKLDQASYDRKEDGSFAGFEDDPPFVYHDGYLSSHYATQNYQEIELTDLQQEAIWTFAALAEDPKFHLQHTFQPGEIEIISNQVVLHSRGDVFDGEAPEEKRHLLRWWVAQPRERNPRGIIPTFAPRSNVRPEGGFAFPGNAELRLPFYPYSRHDGEGQSQW